MFGLEFGTGELIGTLAFTVGSFLFRKLVKSRSDADRAQVIARVAEDAAALVFLKNPHETTEIAVRRVIDALRAAAVTKNGAVLERAAAAAVYNATR